MINKIINNYKIISKIGEGGMGVVYLGEHISLKRKVVLKVLKSIFYEDANLRDRFKNEGIALSKLNHPNIVILFDFIEHEGMLCMVMEFVEGNSLADILKINKKPFSENVFLPIFIKILNAFQYAHNRGIIHRDIKPSNFLLSKDGEPKILDFGIAKIMESDLRITSTGTKMGSLLYMSPEQILGKNIDYRTDIYSLGVTLFEVLTCRIPYDISSESDYEVQTKILRENLKPVNYYNASLSNHVNYAIQKATAKNPAERFQSCDEFAKALTDNNFTNYKKPMENTVARNSISSFKHTFSNYPSDQGLYIKKKNKSSLFKILIFISLLIVIIISVLVYVIFSRNDKTISDKEYIESTPKKEIKKDTIKSKIEDLKVSPIISEDSPEGRVKTWITSLGNQDYKTAYEITIDSKGGSYDKFLLGYGCITKTYIYEIILIKNYFTTATVYADYDSYDPCNNDGRYKQFFHMVKRDGKWYIKGIKNEKIIYYRKKEK